MNIMENRSRIVSIIIGVMCVFVMTGCGKKSLVGEYIGLDDGGILSINSDRTWTFEQEGDWGASDISWEGNWSVMEDGAYKLEVDDETLYLEEEEEGKVHLYSPGNGDEIFRKVD